MTELDMLLKMKMPKRCDECGGIIVQETLHIFKCDCCKKVFKDDFQRIKEYLDINKNATVLDIEHALGISRQLIKECLREGKIEPTSGGVMMLGCKKCNTPIRIGSYCSICASLLGVDTFGEAVVKTTYTSGMKTTADGRKRYTGRSRWEK